jgi:competence protein ComEA
VRRTRLASLAAVAAALLIVSTIPGAAQQAASTPETKASPAPLVNLNTATADVLEKLPGIGPKMAVKIVEYRQKNGAFKKVEELMNVKGIGEKGFLKLRSQITVAAPPVGVPSR